MVTVLLRSLLLSLLSSLGEAESSSSWPGWLPSSQLRLFLLNVWGMPELLGSQDKEERKDCLLFHFK